MDATGLAKGSLYKGFGDKKRLFMLALDSYLTDANAVLLECDTASQTGREALERVFSGVVGMSTRSGVRRGCLSVNSAIELAPTTPTSATGCDETPDRRKEPSPRLFVEGSLMDPYAHRGTP